MVASLAKGVVFDELANERQGRPCEHGRRDHVAGFPEFEHVLENLDG